MNPALPTALRAELHSLRDAGRLRSCPPLEGHSRTRPLLDSRPLVAFCSNDYLGLAAHADLAGAAAAAARRSGFGAAASRLVAGDLPEHRDLEAQLSLLVRLPAALLFPTGYQANIGCITALAASDDLIVSDAANHASIIDGCRLSRARILRFPHRDAAAAERALFTPGPFRRRLLITESLFSMDGDRAPLAELDLAAHRAGALLIVDEAHALGVLGPRGRGLCAEAGVVPDALVGTLGKAFGAAGGFVAGSPELCQLLVNSARTFLFTTAPPPSVAAAAQTAVRISSSPEGDRLRARLLDHVDHLRSLLLRAGLPVPDPPSPIFPVILGPDAAATAASSRLLERGLFVQAIRPPTVPQGTARLRITLSAGHDEKEIDELASAVVDAWQRGRS